MTYSGTFLNGKPATADDLAPLAFAGYAHFTAMQVRGRAVRGLDLHLDRLRTASAELFGRRLPDARIRELLASAVAAAPPDVSLSAFLTDRPGEFTRTQGAVDIDVLVKVTGPATPPAGPLALEAFAHQRHLPHIKHVGEVAKTEFLRRANAHGYDDAAFIDDAGRLSEATIWNLAFWDGHTVIWPQAEVLNGITMRILRRRFDRLGVAQTTRPIRPSDLDDDLAGVVMNSWSPAIPVARIGERTLAGAEEFTALLHRAYAAEPPVAV